MLIYFLALLIVLWLYKVLTAGSGEPCNIFALYYKSKIISKIKKQKWNKVEIKKNLEER